MRFRILVGAAAVVGLIGGATLMARGPAAACPVSGCCQEHRVCCAELEPCCAGEGEECCAKSIRQSSIVEFVQPVLVRDRYVSGQVLIVHDDEKMAQGEPCTTFYRFDKASGPKEELLSFHCVPRRGQVVTATTLTMADNQPGGQRLIAYQLAGDTEVHGIPR